MRATRPLIVIITGVVLLGMITTIAAEGKRKAGKPGMQAFKVGTTRVHVFQDKCVSQEPMVHADEEGHVVFYNKSNNPLTLTFHPTGNLDKDTLTIAAHGHDSVTTKKLAPGQTQVVTQYKIGDCKAPWDTGTKDVSDPNDVVVP